MEVAAYEGGVDTEHFIYQRWSEAFGSGAVEEGFAFVEQEQLRTVLQCHVEVVNHKQYGGVLLFVDMLQQVEYLELVFGLSIHG